MVALLEKQFLFAWYVAFFPINYGNMHHCVAGPNLRGHCFGNSATVLNDVVEASCARVNVTDVLRADQRRKGEAGQPDRAA